MLKKEELMKLSERALAKEYSRIMGLKKPLTKIPTDKKAREPKVDEMLAKLSQSEQPAEAPPAAASSEAAPGAAETTPAPKPEKKKKKETEPKALTVEASDVKNPYRDGSKKKLAFDLYCKGGDRAKIEAEMLKLGVTKSTCATWIYFFSAVIKTGKQPDWKEKREEKK